MNKINIIYLIAGIVVIAVGIGVALSSIKTKFEWNWMALTAVSTILLAVATLILAISTHQMSVSTMGTLELSKSDSLLINRPYAYLESNSRWQFDRDGNFLTFTFNLVNSGKSAALDVRLEFDEIAILPNNDIYSEVANFIPRKVSDDERIDKKKVALETTYTLYPQQRLPNSPEQLFNVNGNLQNKIFEESKALYVKLSLSYKSLPFEETQKEYKDYYNMVFTGTKDSETGKLTGTLLLTKIE